MSARLVELRGLDGWREQWDDLVLRAPLPSPFLRSWWVENGAEDLLLLLVVDGDRLLGGIALQRTRRLGVTVWEVAGGGRLCPDHVDALAEPGHEDAVVAQLRGWTVRQRDGLLFLDGLVAGSLAARAWPGATAVLEQAPYASLRDLPDGDYLTTRSRNFQRSTRKTRRRLTEAGVRHRCVEVADREGFEHALDELGRMHASRGDRDDFLAILPRVRQVLDAGACRGEVEAHLLELGERTVAVELVFALAGVLRHYQLGRDDDHDLRGSGRDLVVRVTESAAERGFAECDFLRGGEAYKVSMADGSRDLMRLQLPLGPRGRLWLAGWRLGRTLRRATRDLAVRRTGQRDPEVETPPRSR